VNTHFSPSLTYEPFYGLQEKPFSLSPDPRFLFRSPAHAPAFDELLGGIRRREGLIVLTGDIGTGKTTLCRSVLQQLDRRTFSAFVPDPFVSREDLLKTLLVDFGVVTVSDLMRGRLNGASRLELSYSLYGFLDSLVPLQAFAVLVIDEAQNLPLPLLEELRILSDLECREKLLQVVLVGQPELRSSLSLPQMRQVAERVSVRCEVKALDGDGVRRYVSHRLSVASAGESRVEFTPAALEAIYQGSAGVPRAINRICDRALHRAHLSGSFTIQPDIVRAAMSDIGAAKVEASRPPPPKPASTTNVTEEVPAILWEFATESERPAARPALIAELSTRQRFAGVAIASLLAVALSLSGTAYLRALGSDAATATPLPLPPRPQFGDVMAPPAPADAGVSADIGAETSAPIAPAGSDVDRGYAIAVATFESRTRAARLVDELTRAGYRAREVELDLGPRGRFLQVIVDGYSSAVEVESDLQRIRALPGYGDARRLDAQ
jgi:general secretion pathway protein A